jgi:TolB-like protein
MGRWLFALILLPSLARGGLPSVAVMPFKDLSGAKGSIGEAIRETVTSDLRDTSGLRMIERSQVDQILAEQNLQASRADLDPTATVKVGKLLGASMIVAGAYQESASSVRLTARFVKVETGEIVGTAKVDGLKSDFLKLQDRISSELLRSAGMEPKKVELLARRPRPKMRSWKTLELYGDAVAEPDDQKKRDILKRTLDEDPGFVYAARDLDELEKRLKQYETRHQRETDRAVKELEQKIESEKDPQKLAMAYTGVFTSLLTQRRWYAVAALARKALSHPPPPTPFLDIGELAHMYLVIALAQVHDYDGVLREGERFLMSHPSSNYFQSVRSQMDSAIAKKRDMQEGERAASDELQRLPPADQADACKLGQLYKQHKQWVKARAQLDACLTAGHSRLPAGTILIFLVQTALEQADWAAARRYLEQLKTVDPKMAKSLSGYEWQIPADG